MYYLKLLAIFLCTNITLLIVAEHQKTLTDHNQIVHNYEQYKAIMEEKKREIAFLEDRLVKHQANEGLWTKTNLGIALGMSGLITAGIAYQKDYKPISLTGLALAIGGLIIGYEATNSRRMSEEQLLIMLKEASTQLDEINFRIIYNKEN